MVIITNTEKELTFNLKLEGADVKDTKAFLTFPVTLKDSGKCAVTVEPGTLKYGTRGSMMIEVIAKDMHFTPWSSEFLIEQKTSTTTTRTAFLESIKKTFTNQQIIKEQKKIADIETMIKAKEALIDRLAKNPNPELEKRIIAFESKISQKINLLLETKEKKEEVKTKANVIAEKVTEKLKLSPEHQKLIAEHYTKKLINK